MMIKVGLTGNIGSGKTLVSEIFRILGAPIFHADTEAKRLYAFPEVKLKLEAIVGQDILDSHGEVDRKKLAGILFGNEKLLKQVNRFIHPLVRHAYLEFSNQSSSQPYSIYEAAILVESGYYKEMDRLIVVHAPMEVRIERVMKRDGVLVEDVMKRARHQIEGEEKLAYADWVIYNDGEQMLIPQVIYVDQELRKLSI